MDAIDLHFFRLINAVHSRNESYFLQIAVPEEHGPHAEQRQLPIPALPGNLSARWRVQELLRTVFGVVLA